MLELRIYALIHIAAITPRSAVASVGAPYAAPLQRSFLQQ